jgi:hypothetical protein
MKKVTYLIGAGASAKAIPMINQIPESIKSIYRLIRSYRDSNVLKEPISTIVDEMFNNLNWLIENSKVHSTIDTFAKKLYITRKHSDLVRFKKTVNILFLFEEMRNDVDNRYDSFFASILDSSLELPNNVKILSWNYDLQFERSFTSYSERKLENSIPDLSVNFPKNRFDRYEKNFIHKINGMVWFTEQLSEKLNYRALFEEIGLELIESLVNNYIRIIDDGSWERILFSWENYDLNESRVYEIKEDVIDTNILVCIGYSFPYFNRKVDKYIVQSMSKLEKVYFQNLDPKQNYERFRSIRSDLKDDQYILNSNCNEFLLPDEL